MSHDDWFGQSEIYAVGALDGEELTQFEAHLTGCQLCEGEVRDARETLTILPRSLPLSSPSPAVWTKLLEQIAIGEMVPVVKKPRVGWLGWGVGASALAALGVTMAVFGSTLSARRQELQRLTAMVVDLRSQVARQEALVQFLQAPDVRLVRLEGLAASPQASGRLLWNPVTGTGILLARGLPQLSQDQVYELWGIAGTEPVPAGLFTVDENGRATVRTPSLPPGKTFDAFAVTLEPAGGVLKPTGPMHLLGKL